MITLYANWTCNALATGITLDDARAKLTPLDCDNATMFGTNVTDVTALDTGPHPISYAGYGFAYLRCARKAFPVVAAQGRARQ